MSIEREVDARIFECLARWTEANPERPEAAPKVETAKLPKLTSFASEGDAPGFRGKRDLDAPILRAMEQWSRASPPPVKPLPVSAPSPAPPVEHLKDFSKGARGLVVAAQKLADQRKHKHVTLLHVLVCALELPAIERMFWTAHADPAAALVALQAELAKLAPGREPSYLSQEMQAYLARARAFAAGAEVTLTTVLRAAVDVPERTLEELDEGLGFDGEQPATARVVTAGALHKILPKKD